MSKVELLDLPRVCLEEIFRNLSFAEISRLGGVCKYFRDIVKSIFRLHFQNQEAIIKREMDKIEDEANRSDKLSVDDHLHIALLLSMLRILLSEAKMLKAHCWRYMRDPGYDFCFPAGILLDEFRWILKVIKDKQLNKYIEPEITTNLFHLGETFYDYFDSKIEVLFPPPFPLEVRVVSETKRKTFLPNTHNFDLNATKATFLRNLNDFMRENRTLAEDSKNTRKLKKPDGKKAIGDEDNETEAEIQERTLFGVKVLDILDCCAPCDFQCLLSQSFKNDFFQISGEYELHDINVLEPLPAITLAFATPERQLNKICRYIRNNVRWTNLFHPLQDLWMLEDAIQIKRDVKTASSLLRDWKIQRTSSRLKKWKTLNEIYHYDYRRSVNGFKNRFGLLVTVQLECPSMQNLPMKTEDYVECDSDLKKRSKDFCSEISLDKLIENTSRESILCSDCKGWSDKTYKFHLELKIQYPSCLTQTVREVILKVYEEQEAKLGVEGSEILTEIGK